MVLNTNMVAEIRTWICIDWLAAAYPECCRFLHESKSSGDSNFIQIQIPLDCYEGVGETMKFSKVEQG